MSDFSQGLSISVVGILITFFSLGVFILIMILLQRVFPPEKITEKEVEEDEPVVQIELDQNTGIGDQGGAIVAAIMVAINYYQTVNQPILGANLEAGRGRWWMTNRISARQTVVLKKN